MVLVVGEAARPTNQRIRMARVGPTLGGQATILQNKKTREDHRLQYDRTVNPNVSFFAVVCLLYVLAKLLRSGFFPQKLREVPKQAEAAAAPKAGRSNNDLASPSSTKMNVRAWRTNGSAVSYVIVGLRAIISLYLLQLRLSQ